MRRIEDSIALNAGQWGTTGIVLWQSRQLDHSAASRNSDFMPTDAEAFSKGYRDRSSLQVGLLEKQIRDTS